MKPPSNPITARNLLFVQLAGLAGTGGLVWLHSVEPRLATEPLESIAAKAGFYVFLAWALSALIAFLLYAIAANEEPMDSAVTSLRVSATAAWFAPAIILLSTLSPAGLFASLALIVNTSRVLMVGWIPAGAGSRETARGNPFPAIWAAFFLQTGVVALLWKNSLLAAGMFALSSAMVTALAVLRSGSKREKPRGMPPSLFSIALTIFLAVIATTAGLKFASYASGTGSGDGGSQAKTAGSGTEVADEETYRFPVGYGGFPGVILRPVRKKSTKLVAPRPSVFKEGEPITRPLAIPFTGEYWMYQPPFIEPPRSSILREGTPLELSFHTSNGSSMSMEARQKLAKPMDLSCCGRLEMDVRQTGFLTDLYLKVSLIDSVARHTLELGTAPVGPEAMQTLRYPIPPGGATKEFNEIRVLYRVGRLRFSRSFSLAVEQFILVPKGH
jgi:hypothetical protein